jgi:hypothetical protein
LWPGRASLRRGALLFLALRLLFTLWAAGVTAVLPPPETPDEAIRPYLGEPVLDETAAGRFLLAPWQRFDTQRYMRIARQGYAAEEDSVFPPLYPALIRAGSALLGGGAAARLGVGLLLSNLATLALFILLHHIVTVEWGAGHAGRAILYLGLFPTGFFLFAAYTESLFLLLAVASLWAGRDGRFWLAGGLGFLAAATRLTGWVLAVPLLYLYLRQQGVASPRHLLNWARLRRLLRPTLLATALPGLALLAFIAYRHWLGLPPLSEMYARYWYQSTGFPGQDLIAAGRTLFFGGPVRRNEYLALALDFASLMLLLATTLVAFRRLPRAYALYAAMLLFFILLPTSPVKPLYSFSRYALAFFPTFIVLSRWGERPIPHRLILYPSLTLALFYSGQFFIWGWVA